MAIKKRSSRTRRIRPVSSRLSEWPSAGSSSHGRRRRTRTGSRKKHSCHQNNPLVAGLGEEASPSPTPPAPPHSAPLTHSASWECLSTLPTNGSPLRHVTHVRPRPPRRHRAGHLPSDSVSSPLQQRLYRRGLWFWCQPGPGPSIDPVPWLPPTLLIKAQAFISDWKRIRLCVGLFTPSSSLFLLWVNSCSSSCFMPVMLF